MSSIKNWLSILYVYEGMNPVRRATRGIKCEYQFQFTRYAPLLFELHQWSSNRLQKEKNRIREVTESHIPKHDPTVKKLRITIYWGFEIAREETIIKFP